MLPVQSKSKYRRHKRTVHCFITFGWFISNSVFLLRRQYNLLSFVLQELKQSFNYGLFCPPTGAKCGKFLDENKALNEYPFSDYVGYLEVSFLCLHCRRVSQTLFIFLLWCYSYDSNNEFTNHLKWTKNNSKPSTREPIYEDLSITFRMGRLKKLQKCATKELIRIFTVLILEVGVHFFQTVASHKRYLIYSFHSRNSSHTGMYIG